MTDDHGGVCGLLFCAGLSTRMPGGKLARKYGATPIVRLAVLSLLRGGVSGVVAVVGPSSEEVREALAGLNVSFAVNENPSEGMASSLRVGVAAIPPTAKYVVAMPGDMPRVRAETVASLLAALAASDRSIAAPFCGGKRGNPVLFDFSRHRTALLALEGDRGGRDLVAALPEETVRVEVDDPGILVDVDTPEELHSLNDLRRLKVLVRGAGEMATGIGHRLRASGLAVAMTETSTPMAVRRTVSFCEAVYDGEATVEGLRAVLVGSVAEFNRAIETGAIPLLVDPELSCLTGWAPDVVIDATIAKRNLGLSPDMAPLVIACGPGFRAGVDAHVVIETNRGHDLGRLIFTGEAEPDTGAPAPVLGYATERVLRAPCDGKFAAVAEIGKVVVTGDLLATVGGVEIRAEIPGVLRGLVRDGIQVRAAMKIGDIDPNGVVSRCFTITDKARALGGSALEAIMAAFNR